MRNRFRPNLTPRAKTKNSPSTSSSQHQSTDAVLSVASSNETQILNSPENGTNNEQGNSLEGGSSVEPNKETTVACESEISPLQKPSETSSSCIGRRSRIRPAVVSVARSRANKSAPQTQHSKCDQEKTSHSSTSGPTNNTQDQLISTSSSPNTSPSLRHHNVTASRAEPSNLEQNHTSVDQHEQPVANLEETETPSGKSNSNAPLTRRKRALPNLASAARRKSSTSTSKECPGSTSKTTKQSSSDESSAKEITDLNDIHEEAMERGGKRARSASEIENVEESAEHTQQLTSEVPQSLEDNEDLSIRKVNRNRRGSNRKLRAPDTNPAKMIMQQLIYYNPKTNPMSCSVESKKSRTETQASNSPSSNSTSGPIEDIVHEDNGSVDASGNDEASTESSAPAPQVKLSADGSIILDEESLLVQTAPSTTLPDSEIVFEDAADGSYNTYLQHRKVERWSMEDTLKFYKALSQVGTDFSLMLPLFPTRKRKELKAKFKKEEKLHRDWVEKALRHRTPIEVELYAPQLEGEEIDDVLDEQL